MFRWSRLISIAFVKGTGEISLPGARYFHAFGVIVAQFADREGVTTNPTRKGNHEE